MARKRVITRTIKTDWARVLCLDLVTGKSLVKDIMLPRTYYRKEDYLRRAAQILDSDRIKACKILDAREESHTYEMTESQFIKYAKQI